MMRCVLGIAVFLAITLLGGCSKESTRPNATALQVSPADGETGVRLDAAVRLTFGAPVDRDLVEHNLHLISERAMADSLCPDSATMNHPDMAHWMNDPDMMRHLDAYHATPGRTSWDASGMICSFQPDSAMAPGTGYMIHLGPEMMSMLGAGMMGMHGSGSMSGHVMMHFTTMAMDGYGRHHQVVGGSRVAGPGGKGRTTRTLPDDHTTP